MKSKTTDKENRDVTHIILESISDGVFTVDHKWRIMSFNRAAEKITGIFREEAIGRHCWEVFRSNMCEKECALKRTMKEGTELVNTSTYIVNAQKKRVPIIVSTSLLKDENGRTLGGVETFQDLSLVEELRKELSTRYKIGDMVSRSSAMKRIFDILPQIAESDSSVLIEGETGTGKELLTRAIHDLSARKNKPFVAINCGALPDTLLESELFGYKAGAFTNAVKDKIGHFAVAEGGTILLDEIGDISSAFQVRLLRVLEEKKYQPLGATQSIGTNVRIVAATNKNISDLVKNEVFRQDLFYRINVVNLQLPPLRKRKEDIPLLIDQFIDKMNRLRGKAVKGISRESMRILMSQDFPGNIRELENIIEYAFVLCSNGLIQPHHLPDTLGPHPVSSSTQQSLGDELKSTEIRTILDALKRNHFNRLATARELGMHKSTLFRKINKLGVILPKIDGRSKSENTE